MLNKLVLGTVQFGQSYGVANLYGQPSLTEVKRILNLALNSGLNTLDTARTYGNSEQVLGKCGVQDWRVITKLPARQVSGGAQQWVRACIEQSLSELKVEYLEGLLLHQPSLLQGVDGDTIYKTLLAFKAEGRIRKIGISVYEPAELEVIVPRFAIDIVQLPFNLLDRRMMLSGWMQRLNDYGIEIHARSCFLQGLLLMPIDQRPAKFDRWSNLWQTWHKWLEQTSQTALGACLSYSLSHTQINRVVVGTESVAQLMEILAAAKKSVIDVPDNLISNDTDLINPFRWNKL